MAGAFTGLADLSAEAIAAGVGFGLGIVAAPALAPITTDLQQSAYQLNPNKALDAATWAEIVAEALTDLTTGQGQANLTGVGNGDFASLVDVTMTAPGTGELLNMLNRQTINPGNFTHGLRKAKLEPMWDSAIADLANQKISATDLAYMMVRGVLPDDGLLGMSLPTQADNLQLPPQYSLDPVAEAALTGWDKERLGAMVARSGLAMAPVMAAQANFRGILTDNDYLLTIARGDLFPAYAGPVKEASRAIPSPGEFMELQLRGWLTQAQAEAGAALHGMTKANADLLYQLKRRPLSPHQIKQAEARGGVFDTTNAPFNDPYLSSVHEANLGPEWYDLAITLQGSYPSLFQLNRLVTGGTIDATTGADWAAKAGLADEVVTALHASWTGGGAATADKNISSAQTHLKTATHKSYIGYEISDATATSALEAAGVAAASVQPILALWQEERSLVRKSLTAANLKKALSTQAQNPATGVAWTQAEVIARLLELGYNNDDAVTFLEV